MKGSLLCASYSPCVFDIIFSGNNAGFLQTITFMERSNKSCLYSVREFVSITVNAQGLIHDFDIYFDRAAHDGAKARCSK